MLEAMYRVPDLPCGQEHHPRQQPKQAQHPQQTHQAQQPQHPQHAQQAQQAQQLQHAQQGAAARAESVVVMLDEEAVVSGAGAKLLGALEAERLWAQEHAVEAEEEQAEVAAEVR